MAVGHHAIVEMLARSLGPGNVDLRLNDGKTALMLACKNGFAEVAAELLNFGADPNLQESNDADGFSAIMHAALYGHDECIAVVLRHVKKKVVEVEADLPQRVSLHSNKRGSLAPAVQTTNKNGDTALHLASLFGQRKVVQLLLRERADVNALNEKGETALHNASKNSHAQVACALMTGGAEVNTQDRDHGYAALHYCCISNGGKDVADALMEVGAEVDLVGMDGNTPLHLACMSGNHGVVDAMMKRKARSCNRSMSLHSSATMLCPFCTRRPRSKLPSRCATRPVNFPSMPRPRRGTTTSRRSCSPSAILWSRTWPASILSSSSRRRAPSSGITACSASSTS